MSAFTESFTENPMLVEWRRFFRKFLGLSRFQKFHLGTLIFVGVSYSFLVLVAVAYREAITSDYVLEFQTALLCFVVPTVTYGAIAGEREKRTWDLLVIAPIRKSQIIIGKFICAGLVVVGTAFLFLPLVAICAFGNHEPLFSVIANETTSVGFGLGVAALGIFLSSLVNRGFTAQIAIYCVLFIWLIMLPLLLAEMFQTNQFDLWVHPFSSIAVRHKLFDPYAEEQWVRAPALGYSFSIQFLLYALMTSGFLWLAINRIGNRKRMQNA